MPRSDALISIFCDVRLSLAQRVIMKFEEDTYLICLSPCQPLASPTRALSKLFNGMFRMC